MSNTAPNDQFTATVRNLSHKGLGVVNHLDGRIFFVKDGWTGEVGIFEIDSHATSYDEIAALKWLERSPERVSVPCPHQGTEIGQCSGCPWMGINYAAQLSAKEIRVKFLLDKNQIQTGELRSILGSSKAFGYRNRAQFKTDGQQLGFVSEGTNVLAPINECLVLNDRMRGLLNDLKKKLPNAAWKPMGKFPWSYLDVDDHQSLGEVVPNVRRPFRQGNDEQNEVMKFWIVTSLQAIPKDWPIIEAFCGSGNFTEALSQAGFEQILAAEVRGSAIQQLKAKNLPGVDILEIDMNEKGVWQQLGKRHRNARVLIIDPPREGVEKRVGMFKELPNLSMILYISCEPATWSRDVKDFQLNGWKVAHVTPLDLFPHTPHVELLSLLVRS